MPLPARAIRTFRLLLIMLGLASASVAALATTPNAGAEANYSCPNCAKESGPNQSPLNYDNAINYSGTGVCADFWEFKGGSSYRRVERHCTPNPGSEYQADNAFPCSNYSGHGEVERYYEKFTYHMAGNQKWICE